MWRESKRKDWVARLPETQVQGLVTGWLATKGQGILVNVLKVYGTHGWTQTLKG